MVSAEESECSWRLCRALREVTIVYPSSNLTRQPLSVPLARTRQGWPLRPWIGAAGRINP
jgi:hypothetical protein